MMAMSITRMALALALATMGSGATAKWQPINEDESFYVDPATIQKNGMVAKMWVLLNLDTPDTSFGKPVLSLKTQKEYDCAGERIRDLSMSAHSGKMGGGNVVTSDAGSEPGKWEPFRHDSSGEKQWRVACGLVVLNERADAKGRSADSAGGDKQAVRAGWLKVTDTDSFIGYADQASLRKNGNTVTIWALYDFKEVILNRQPSFLARSSKDQFEFDCDRAKWRALSSTLYAESWGRGKSTSLTRATGDWAWVGPESFGDALLKIACGKGRPKPAWVRIDSKPDFDYYVEVPARPRQENTVAMRTMRNYEVPQRVGPATFLSSTLLNEYDCAYKRMRILGWVTYANAMGQGQGQKAMNDVEESSTWEAVVPGSNGESVWKVACGKITL